MIYFGQRPLESRESSTSRSCAATSSSGASRSNKMPAVRVIFTYVSAIVEWVDTWKNTQ